MTLRLDDSGIAIAYATVGVGEVVPEMKNAEEAFDRFKRESPGHAEALSEPEIVFLLGQADIATIFQTSNFQRVFDLRYPRADSHAAMVNWVFSVLYDLGRPAVRQRVAGELRFILHLRLRRAVYAYPGIEEAIVNKLMELLGTHKKDARIHAGLGWSDLIVDGYFTPATFHELIDFIINVHGLKIRYGSAEHDSLPVLQRMLTVFGYTGDPPPLPDVKHLTFLRARPGEYDTVEGLLRAYGSVYILDGKADFMVVSANAASDWLTEQRKLGDGRYSKFLRKVETHVMFFPAEEFKNRATVSNLYIDVGNEAFHQEKCGCEDLGDDTVNLIETTMSALARRKLLPTEQRYAIDNTLFLLTATLRDSSICCDTCDAVMACYDGLLKILRGIADKSADTPLEAGVSQYEEIVAWWRQLDEWHRFTELLLRQRTVGSYEEILGQSDRSVVYSGGVQKFLYLADQLMIDFAMRVQPIDPPKFATIYDSVKTILSFRTGLVRVPTSKIFRFPLVVADLWHEVAGALFFLRLGKEIRDLAPSENEREFLAHIADHYADIIVYLHGFRGDFQRFLASLAHVWNVTYGDVPDAVAQFSVGQFLLRAYLIYEFDQVRRVQRDQDLGDVDTFYDPDLIASKLVSELSRILDQHDPTMASRFREADWTLLRNNLKTQDFSNFHRNLYRPFVQTKVQAVKNMLDPFELGEITLFADTDDMNALFNDLAYSILTKSAQAPFKMMASLGKSAANEYHRRQITRRDLKRATIPSRDLTAAEDGIDENPTTEGNQSSDFMTLAQGTLSVQIGCYSTLAGSPSPEIPEPQVAPTLQQQVEPMATGELSRVDQTERDPDPTLRQQTSPDLNSQPVDLPDRDAGSTLHQQIDPAGTALKHPTSSHPERNYDAPARSQDSSHSGFTFKTGARIARQFTIATPLGSGADAEVYAAEDTIIGQTVALKIFHGRPDKNELTRLMNEVRLGREVTHPNVCKVFEVGRTRGRPFIAMEYVEGDDLRGLLHRIGRLPQETALAVGRDLCAGLAALHAKNIVHRDLKPGNVRLDSQGRAKITDFGLAVFADSVIGDSAGTPEYMAPEQLTGSPATKASDVYAIGLILYELFTGVPFVKGNTWEEFRESHATIRDRRPSTLFRELDHRIDEFVVKCLAEDPEARPTAAQMSADLSRIGPPRRRPSRRGPRSSGGSPQS